MSGPQPITEYETEPVPGLPEPLPEGEEILWQGAPRWRSLARRAFHVRKVAVYFALLAAWRIAGAHGDGATPAEAVGAAVTPALLGLAAVGILALLAWLHARATVYTLTNRRLVLRIGVAIPLVVNLPFRVIRAAQLETHADGTGAIPLDAEGAEQLGFLMLWPHARPWAFGGSAQPMLRSIPDARAVAAELARALGASTPTPDAAEAPAGEVEAPRPLAAAS